MLTPMNKEQLWKELTALPPVAQKQVWDLIAYLKTQVVKPRLREEPFVGIWRDNDAMTDSSAWVRAAREHEWK